MGFLTYPAWNNPKSRKLRPRVRQSRTISQTMKPRWTCASFAQFLSLELMKLGLDIASNYLYNQIALLQYLLMLFHICRLSLSLLHRVPGIDAYYQLSRA